MLSCFPALFLLFVVIFLYHRSKTNAMSAYLIAHKKETSVMLELAKRFVDHECIIYTFNGSQIAGVIKEISGNALLVENNGTTEMINLDFIVRIRDFPRGKNGKKKSVILD